MVSAKKYLLTFFKVMPQRAKLIKKLMEEKAKYDKAIEKKQLWSDSERNALLALIGEDKFFKKASGNRQCIRFYLGRFVKSFNYFGAKKADIFDKGIENLEELRRNDPSNPLCQEIAFDFFSTLGAFVANNSSALADHFRELQIIYENEVAAINKSDFIGYLSQVRKERKIFKDISDILGGLKINSKKVIAWLRFVQLYLKNPKKRDNIFNNASQSLLAALAVISSFLLIVFVISGTIAYFDNPSIIKYIALHIIVFMVVSYGIAMVIVPVGTLITSLIQESDLS